jgi:hypothetical protein
MDAQIPSSDYQTQRPLPLVKAGSMEWSGDPSEPMRPELRTTLFILATLALLIGLLLVLVPAQLRALASETNTNATTSDISLQNADASCEPRRDWASYPIQPDDSLPELSRRTGISVTMLANSNCLENDQIRSGNTLYLPAIPAQ